MPNKEVTWRFGNADAALDAVAALGRTFPNATLVNVKTVEAEPATPVAKRSHSRKQGPALKSQARKTVKAPTTKAAKKAAQAEAKATGRDATSGLITVCPVCLTVSPTRSALGQHMKTKHDKKFSDFNEGEMKAAHAAWEARQVAEA
jgi:hypothetical protein